MGTPPMTCFPANRIIVPLIIVCLALTAFVSSGHCRMLEQINIPSSPNPVGSGARALGMGGAFIAIADDATAASWNPGGLIQLEKPEISIVGACFQRSRDTGFADIPEASGKHSVYRDKLNYLSFSYPFRQFNRNMILSVNYQDLYDFNNQWHFPILQQADTLSVTQTVDAVQTGRLSALGLAWCVQLRPDLSLGATVNLWENRVFSGNHWEQTTHRNVQGTFSGHPLSGESLSHDTYDFSGLNFNLGMLWHINSRWTLGAILKTPFTADILHDRYYAESLFIGTGPGSGHHSESFSTSATQLDMPMSYGMGLACRMSDEFTVSADIYRTQWDDFLYRDSGGNITSPITGLPESQSGIDATHQIRFGGEYLVIKPPYIIPLRAGLFYDPAPAQNKNDAYYGLSLGGGLAYKKYLFDIACQYRFGDNVGQSISQSLNATQDVKELTVYMSLIVHF